MSADSKHGHDHGHAHDHGHDHGHGHGHGHEEPSFIRKYIFSEDHKVIGVQFLIVSLLFLAVGGLLALAVRYQIAWPNQGIPILNQLYGENVVKDQKFYNMLFTMHATFMIFFAIIPLLVGFFGNYLIPLKIGARDMAFPFLNMLSFWTALPAGIIMIAALFVSGGDSATYASGGGWTNYPTLSEVGDGIAGGKGQTLWLISLIVLGASSIMGAINYLTTIINMRAPGMSFHRLPLSIWSLFITSILVLFATPVLTSALGMLVFDREVGTTFFLNGPKWPGAEGQPLLWQHIFWFYSHPAVYIMILPAMGVVSDILPVFARKPIFGYKAMAYAMAGIAGLGFIVWGHHMFQSGMNPVLGTTFMISTMFIAVPSAIKTFNWLGTLWGGQIQFTTPMLHALSFVAMFAIGGLSGIYMASTPVDIFIHDTYFIVAHIHYVLFGGSLFGIFAGITFWFPKIFGRMMSERFGKVHFFLTFIFFNLTFFAMHVVGAGGMMRRIANPTHYEFLQPLQPWNILMTYAAIALGLSQIIFFANFVLSIFMGEKASANPWRSTTLEWHTSTTPPPHGNFDKQPHVYHGPYEFSSPLTEEDFLPQWQKLGEAQPAKAGGHGH